MGALPGTARTAWVLVLATCALTYVLSDDDLVREVSYLTPLVGAAAVAWIGASRGPRERRLVPRLIACGLTLSALGDVLWSVVDHTGGDTDLSVADPVWLASYVFLGLALAVVLGRSRRRGADLDFVIDAVTIVVVSLLVFWRISIDDIVADTTVSPWVRATWATYPVLDAVLLAMVLRIVLSPRARTAVSGWFAAGVVLWLAADVGYLLVSDHDGTVALDVAWMVAPALMARAAFRDVPSGPAMPAPGPAAPWVPLLLVAVCPLLIPPGLELVADLRGEHDRPGQLFVGMVALIVLAFLRTGRLLLSEQRAQRELHDARDAALAASEAKSIFLANISHELRTPLTTVMASAELLEDTVTDPVQLRLLEKVRRSGERLMSLLEGLLDFSRIEAGQAELQSVPFALQDVVAEVEEAYRPRARARGIGLEVHLAPDLPDRVVGDPQRVFQIVANLVDNAVKFTHQGGVRLGVERAPEEEGVVITVSDTGIGIRQEDQAPVFGTFTQVDGSITRRYEGSGLGLAICKELVELMGGTIAVTSRLGAGSTFVVRLPLA